MRIRLAGALVLVCAATASAQSAYIQGVFVGTGKGPVELIAWAELTRSGRMEMAPGTSLEDVPLVESVQRILCSLPNANVDGVWVASDAIFRDPFAERRQVAWTFRMFNVYTTEVRAVDLEDPEKVARLVRQVRPNGSEPAFAFIGVNYSGFARHYLVRLR